MQMIRRLSPTDRLKQIIDRLIQANPDAPDHVGTISYRASDQALDGGGYGDPFDDGKPDFVKRDDAGWI